MITSAFVYLLCIALIASFFTLVQKQVRLKIFEYLPAVVMIYALSMLLAGMGVFAQNEEIQEIYSLTKSNLLPAMLFLMLLQIDFSHFLQLGRSLLIAYVAAVLSIAFGFVVVMMLLDFSKDGAAAFGALAGSWMGGTANMVAVGSALNVSQEAYGYALIVDSFNYTLWVMFLLFTVPFAKYFNTFTKADTLHTNYSDIGCACTVGLKHYWLLLFFALLASLASQLISEHITVLNTTTTVVLTATLFGVLGSFTKLKTLNGSSEIASTILYILIALIGSRAVFESFSGVGLYVLAGFCILFVHAVIMVVVAKIFKLDLFSIAVASLSNIGGVASAPILAAAYNKSLVSVGVLMAIMGYLIGTFGGLAVGNILMEMAQ